MWLALLLVCIFLPVRFARADCLRSDDPLVQKLDALVYQDPKKVVTAAHAELDLLKRAASPDRKRIAWFYAVLADAYSALELDREARQAAAAGLLLVPRVDDPARLALLSAHATNVYDSDGLANAVADIESAQRTVARGSLADLCLSIALGRLQHRQDRDDLAVLTLTRAYRESAGTEKTPQRVRAAAALSNVVANLGDHAQALALNQEVIDWDIAHEAWLDLSVTRYLRGEIYKRMREYALALKELAEARRLSVLIDDRQGVAFADLRMCQARIELRQWASARAECKNALEIFTASHSTDVIKESRALIAQIDLAEGHTARALTTLNGVLDRDGTDMPPRRVAMLYQLRAQAHAALNDYRRAYADLEEYARRYAKVNDAERSQQSAALRARFEIDRQVERSEALQRELALTQERSQRQQEQLQWIIVGVVAGGFAMVLLTYILVINLRHRRQLSRLANYDALTALPNRRRTAQLATQALQAAASGHQTLTVGIIDLDHFKTINDRCGHAVGDYVLQEFARIGLESLRSTDVFGRWGGEEFLVILPDTTLDTAVATLERLRSTALNIALPSTAGGLRVSFSAGLATNEQGTRTLDEVIAQADVALYEAKNQGRDLVRIASESYRMASTGVRRALRGIGRTQLSERSASFARTAD